MPSSSAVAGFSLSISKFIWQYRWMTGIYSQHRTGDRTNNATQLDCAHRAQDSTKAKISTKSEPGFESGEENKSQHW